MSNLQFKGIYADTLANINKEKIMPDANSITDLLQAENIENFLGIGKKAKQRRADKHAVKIDRRKAKTERILSKNKTREVLAEQGVDNGAGAAVGGVLASLMGGSKNKEVEQDSNINNPNNQIGVDTNIDRNAKEINIGAKNENNKPENEPNKKNYYLYAAVAAIVILYFYMKNKK